jgi:hypothetical protein
VGDIDAPPQHRNALLGFTTTLIHILFRLIIAPRLTLATSTTPTPTRHWTPFRPRFTIPPGPIPDAGRPSTNGTADKQHPDHVTIHDEIEFGHTHQRH